MSRKSNGKSGGLQNNGSRAVTIQQEEGKSEEYALAEFGFSPLTTNAVTAGTYSKELSGELDICGSIDVLRDKAKKMRAGDLSDAETTLTVQAITLDAIFNSLARRAALNMGQHLGACETYLRLALKAQAQCRATLETLAEVKYPKTPTFVRQQNVAYQQQVNNGNAVCNSGSNTRTHAHGKAVNQSNELLEAQDGERLDTRAAGKSSGANKALDPMDKIYRAENCGR